MAALCIAPEEIEEGDLVAALHGEATPEVMAHLAACPACQAEFQVLAESSQSLIATLFRQDCPAPTDLMLYLNGMLPARQMRTIAQHLATCEFCPPEIEALNLPPAVAPAPSLGERLAEGGRRLIAAMLVSPPPGALAVRGGERRPLIYQAEAYQLMLSLVPPLVAEDAWQLEGQLIGPLDIEGGSAGQVSLIQAGEVTHVDRVDDLGFFALDGIPAGRYTLQVALGEGSILIEDFGIA